MADQQSDNYIRSYQCPECYLCHSQGRFLYRGLQDRLFGAPGEWNFRECSNPGCSLVWLDPMPLADDLNKAYLNYFTHRDTKDISEKWFGAAYMSAAQGYLASRYGYRSGPAAVGNKLMGRLIYLHPGLREYLDFSVMYLPAQPEGRLLDVGCGSGHAIKFMQDLGWLVEGVDFDPAAVENARAKGLHVRFGSLEAQNYQDNCFDVVTMSHLIEHVHEPLGLMHECYRILKPGGRLVMVTPNSWSWGHKIFKSNWLALDPPRHLHIFSVDSLRSLAQKAGFEKIKISTTIREANKSFTASRSIQRTGKYIWGSPRKLMVRLWGMGMQMAEWAILKLKPHLGEEIAVTGVK